MSGFIPVLNAFIEDTCVLTVIAYLPARGRILALLDKEQTPHRDVYLGVALGALGLTEIIFPGARAPYVAHTLFITFAVLIGGLRIGLSAAGIVVLGAGLLEGAAGMSETALTLLASALVAAAIRRLFHSRFSLLRGAAAGVCAQAAVVFLHRLPIGVIHASHAPDSAWVSIPANGFGVLLLQLVLNDARMRAAAEHHRLEAERAHSLMTEAQLAALRARIRPHFLFNAHTSIAALCSIAPDKAEAAISRLSQLMRRALEAQPRSLISLAEELEYVRAYLDIEKYRLEDHLCVQWEIDPASAAVPIPAFSLQTLVENAVSHGIAPKMQPGTVRIVARVRARYTLIAVADDGVGMTPTERAKARTSVGQAEHGLQITTQQLTLLFDRSARLRLFSREDAGTLVAFAVPNQATIREDGR